MISNAVTELSLEQLLTDSTYHRRIEYIARSLTRGRELTWEDAAQSAHFKVLQAAQSGKFYYGGTKEFYSWAAKVAHRTIIDLLRHEYRRPHISLNQPIKGTDLTLIDTVADPYENWAELEQVDLIFKVREAIAELDQCHPQRHYRMLWIYRVQGLTQTQMAQHLNMAQGTVSKRWQELTIKVAEYLGLAEAPSDSPMGTIVTQRSNQLLDPDQQSQLRQRSSQSW